MMSSNFSGGNMIWPSNWENVGESGEYLPSRLGNIGASAHDKIGHLKHK
jgi:hypothetical protein